MDMVPPSTSESLRQAECYSAKRRKIQQAPFVSRCPCENNCSITGLCEVPMVDLDIGGLPCVDYALSGLRRQEEGPTAPLFVVWARRHKRQKTKVVILENAPALCQIELIRTFGSL